MTDFNTYKFGFVGLGLIGGSIARAIREQWPNAQIIAYNPSRDTLQEARQDGVVNYGNCDQDVQLINQAMGSSRPLIGNIFSDCDIVFLCAPVQKNAENLAEVVPYLKSSAILTDIGSTKTDIHDHVRALDAKMKAQGAAAGIASRFIGGHPMTGSERTRYRNSKAQLLENAYYIIAPEPEVPQEKTDMFRSFVNGLHAIPLVLDCSFHDFAAGAVSHLPHVISASLVNLVRQSDNSENVMKMIAAGGFKDITRISSSSPEMWEQICLSNRDNLLRLIDAYILGLQDIRGKIEQSRGEDIYSFFDNARTYRDSFSGNLPGALDRLFTVHVEIADRPAALAEVVMMLAVNAINIKNVSISHNREYQQGVLCVEFDTQKETDKARDILVNRGFHLY